MVFAYSSAQTKRSNKTTGRVRSSRLGSCSEHAIKAAVNIINNPDTRAAWPHFSVMCWVAYQKTFHAPAAKTSTAIVRSNNGGSCCTLLSTGRRVANKRPVNMLTAITVPIGINCKLRLMLCLYHKMLGANNPTLNNRCLYKRALYSS